MYCTLAEILDDLNLAGVKSEEGLLRHMRAASQYIERDIGQFVPRYETLSLEGNGSDDLLVRPLLRIASITNDGSALSASDYRLLPAQRMWRNGPYGLIERANGGGWSTVEDGVVIAGWWGMYEETLDLDAAITTTDGESMTLTVLDGSKVSPGMVLLVENEQIEVESTGGASSTGATLAGDATDDDDELTLSDGSAVHAGEVIKIGFEHLRVLDVESNTALVARGWNESRRAAHLTGAAISVYRSFQVRRGANGSTAAAHASAAAYRYLAPGDVNYLCRQMAALMLKKAQTGFMGRSGNDDLGTGFWVNEFPRNQVDAVKSNYFWGGR